MQRGVLADGRCLTISFDPSLRQREREGLLSCRGDISEKCICSRIKHGSARRTSAFVRSASVLQDEGSRLLYGEGQGEEEGLRGNGAAEKSLELAPHVRVFACE